MAWSAVLSSPYNSETQSVFALDGENRKRFEGVYSYEWGIDAPDTAVILEVGAGTGLTGEYNSVYTYARKERGVVVCESNPSPTQTTAQTLDNESLVMLASLTDDDQVNCIRFYRTTAGGSTYYYCRDVNYVNRDYACVHDWEDNGAYITSVAYRFTTEDENNSREVCHVWELIFDKFTQTDNQIIITSKANNREYGDYIDKRGVDDNTDDSALGTAVESDHNRPPVGSFVMGPTDNGTLFIVKSHRVYYCKPGRPEYWPSTYYLEISVPQYPLVCGVLYDNGPFFLDKRTIYYLSGSIFADLPNLTTYKPIPMASKTGTVSAAATAAVSGLGIFHTGKDGIYLFQPGGTDEKITDAVDPIFRGETVNGVEAVGDINQSWLLWFDNKLYFGYPSVADTSPKRMLVFDPTRQKIRYYTYDVGFVAACNDKYNTRFLACTAAGNLWELEDQDAEDDNGTAIEWELETKQFTLQTRKHYPRWNKYDIDSSDATSAAASTLLDGTEVQSHTLSDDRNTRRRLIDIANGDKFSIRISGSGPVSVYAIESE